MKTRFSNYFSLFKYVFASVISGAISLVFLPLLTHSMNAFDFANFSKSLLYAQMIATPSVFGLSAYLTTVVVKNDYNTNNILRAFSDWFLLLFILFIVMLLSAFALGYSVFVIVLLTAVSYARAFQAVGVQAYRLLNSFSSFSAYLILCPLSFFVISIICAKVTELSGESIFYIASVVYFFSALYLWRKFIQLGWIDKVWVSKVKNPKYIRFALGAFAHSLAGLAITSWDKMYIALLLSPQEFGEYIISAQFSGGLVLVYTSVSQALIPKMYLILTKKAETILEYSKFTFAIGSGFFVLFAIFEIAIGPMIRLLLPIHLHSVVPIARLLGVAALLQGLYFISSAVLFYYRRTFSLALITLACGVLGAVLAWISNLSSILDVTTIAIVMWGTFFVVTTSYSLILIKKNV